MDWNIGRKDTPTPATATGMRWASILRRWAILDGGGFGDDGTQKDLGQNFMFSETHVFTQR
jgi:hypothetical protein